MAESSFPPNSDKSKEKKTEKEPEKHLTPVISGGATVKKKTFGSKLFGSFGTEDAKTVTSTIISNVAIPAIKKFIDDVFTTAIHVWLWGGGVSNSKSIGSKVSYKGEYYDYSTGGRKQNAEREVYNAYDYDNVEFDTLVDAREVLNAMDDIVDQYGLVKVADLFELADITPEYPCYHYGWKNISSAQITRKISGKYVINFPKAMPIKSIKSV